MHCFYKENKLRVPPLSYFELDPLSCLEAFLWSLVSGQLANKVELYLEND